MVDSLVRLTALLALSSSACPVFAGAGSLDRDQAQARADAERRHTEAVIAETRHAVQDTAASACQGVTLADGTQTTGWLNSKGVASALADAWMSPVVYVSDDAAEASPDLAELGKDGVPDNATNTDLAQAAQNPIADLISLPFQYNLNFDTGPLEREVHVLNIQPVIPFHLNDDWNLITRTILPVVHQPALFSGDDHDTGLGDLQFTAFLSPKEPVKGWTVGAGPVVQMPTATDEDLGARMWSLGPSAVVLRIDGRWVYGALIQNVWSLGGPGDSSVNAFLLQPFVNYNLDEGWYLVSSPIITADWRADSDDRWVVPVGGGIGRIVRLGKQPANISAQAFYNVETPEFGPDWNLRIQFQLLFPR